VWEKTLAHDMTNKSARQGVTGRDSVEYQMFTGKMYVRYHKMYYILVYMLGIRIGRILTDLLFGGDQQLCNR